MDFVRSITLELNEKEIPAHMIEEVKKLMPDKNIRTVSDLAKLIRSSVEEYSMIVLLSMSKLKRFPTKVKMLAKVAEVYEKVGNKAISINKLKRMFDLKQLEENFKSLRSLTNEGLDLASFFFEMYEKIAPLSKDLKDFLKRKKILNTRLQKELNFQEIALKEKIAAERNCTLQEDLQAMYGRYIKDLSSSSTDKKTVWAQIVDTDIEKAKTEKVNAEKRLRDYTFRMYGVFTSLWKNDVAQARIDVAKWTEVLDRLTEEKKKGFQDNLTEKIQEYKNLKIEADNDAKQYRNRLDEIIDPDLERIKDKIKDIERDIEAQNGRKQGILNGTGDDRASAERLIEALEATESFATASLQQTIAQNTFQQGHEDDYGLLFTLLEDLFIEDTLSLETQKIYIEQIENIAKDSQLLSFLAESNSLLTYPVLEKIQLERIDQQMLPMRSEL